MQDCNGVITAGAYGRLPMRPFGIGDDFLRRVNKLLSETKRLVRQMRQQMVCAIVSLDGESWVAEAHLWRPWDKKPVVIERSTHHSMSEATDYLRKLYPDDQDAPVVIIDV